MKETLVVQPSVFLKAQMLCQGVAIPSSLSSHLIEIDPTFIHGAVFYNEVVGAINTSVWDSQSGTAYPEAARYTATMLAVENSVATIGNGQATLDFYLLNLGDVGNVEIQGIKLKNWFSIHNPNTLFVTPSRQCIYITSGEPCIFCTFEGGKINKLSEDNFRRCLALILQQHPKILSVAIGSGTTNLRDMGISYFVRLARIASEFGLECSVELVPPENLNEIAELEDSPIGSFVFSLEVWNEEKRRYWCKGKGNISKNRYFRAWEWSLEKLGENSVASVLLAGTESLDDTLAGARNLIQRGVVPLVIPLRHYPTSRFDNWVPVDPSEYIKLQQKIAFELFTKKLRPSSQKGCTACGGCSLESNLM